MRKVRRVMHRLAIDLDDDIAGAESALLTPTGFFNGAYEHAVAVLDPKKISELGSNVLDHQPTARHRVDNHHRYRQFKVGHRRHLWNLVLVFETLRLPRHRLFAIGELNFDGLRLAVTADAKRYYTARRSLLDHSA